MLNVTLDDPSEWPSGFSALKKIDSLLRCPICLEFLDIAVIVPKCAHSYCSLCIRKHITYKECCPTCTVPVTGGDLKCNRLLDQVVTNFKVIRKKLIGVLKLYVENPAFSQPLRLKDKRKSLQETKENVNSADEFQCDGGTPLFRDPKSSQGKKIRPRNTIDSVTIPDDNVETTCCPVCTKKIPLGKINRHLDSCLAEGDNNDNADNAQSNRVTSSPCVTPSVKRKRRSSHLASPTSPIASPMKPIVLTSSLNSLQDKELKTRASEYGLNTQGTRKQLIKRIEQYILLYNCQCDSLEPMSKSMIAKEVSKNERILLMHGYTPGILIDTNDRRYTEEERIDFCITYSKKHAKHYQTLIDEVKSRLHDVSAPGPATMLENTHANHDDRPNYLETAESQFVFHKEEGATPVTMETGTGDSDNEAEPILIDSSDPASREPEEPSPKRKASEHEKFGYVPNWFDPELLNYSLDKQTTKPNGDIVKVPPADDKTSDKASTEKGAKGKLKKSKSSVSAASKKKTNVQSGNIASYFTGAGKNKVKDSVKSSGLANARKSTGPVDKPCCSKTVKKNTKPRVLVVDDSDSQSDHDTTIQSTSVQSSHPPPSSPTTVDLDEEVMGGSSPSMLEDVDEDEPSVLQDVKEDPPSVLEDVPDNETPCMSGVNVVHVDSDTGSETDDELSPVLFRDSKDSKQKPPSRKQSEKKPLTAAERPSEKEADTSRTSLCSELNAEISELVDRAIANPREFDSDGSDIEERSFINKSTFLKKKTVPKSTDDKNIAMNLKSLEAKESLHDVVPAPPTDFFFSQAEF